MMEYKNIPCKFYFSPRGWCKYGDLCSFSHTIVPQQQQQPHFVNNDNININHQHSFENQHAFYESEQASMEDVRMQTEEEDEEEDEKQTENNNNQTSNFMHLEESDQGYSSEKTQERKESINSNSDFQTEIQQVFFNNLTQINVKKCDNYPLCKNNSNTHKFCELCYCTRQMEYFASEVQRLKKIQNAWESEKKL